MPSVKIYTYHLTFYDHNNLNISIHGTGIVLYFPVSCTGTCTPLYLRLPIEGASAPKHVGVI